METAKNFLADQTKQGGKGKKTRPQEALAKVRLPLLAPFGLSMSCIKVSCIKVFTFPLAPTCVCLQTAQWSLANSLSLVHLCTTSLNSFSCDQRLLSVCNAMTSLKLACLTENAGHA